jgi:DNA-binding transcriptional ArsR family regulator
MMVSPPTPTLEVTMPTLSDRAVNPTSVKAARRKVIDTDEAQRLSELLAVLGEPTRARILFALGAVNELCVGELAVTLDVSDDAVGYALKNLRLAGLVRGRKAGRAVYYRLAEGFPHEMLEHCLRDLLAISPENAGVAR